MKKFAKIISAAFIFAAILTGVSAQESTAGINVNDSKIFKKFDPSTFKGEWITGKWDFHMEVTGSGTVDAKVTFGPEKDPESDGDYITVMDAVVNGEKNSSTASSKEFREMLIALNTQMSQVTKYITKDVKVTGNPYLVANKDKSIIAMDLLVVENGQTVVCKIIMKKASSEAK